MDALRRAAESEMRREAPRGALGECSKRRRVDVQGDDGNDDGGRGGSDGDGDDLSQQPQRRPWLRFAYSGASSLESESTLGFVVSSMIRKERSASREATGVLCSLLGVAEAEEEEVEVEGGKGAEEKDERDKARDDDDDKVEKKEKPLGPCLIPTLSPVKLGCRGLSLLVYRGGKASKKRRFEPGAASRCVDELVRSVLSAREEREKGKLAKKGKRGAAKAAENDGAAEAAAEAEAAEEEEEAEAAEEGGEEEEGGSGEKAASFQPLFFVRRVVPVDAAVVEGAGGENESGLSVLERLAGATRALVAGLDLRSLVEGRDGDCGDCGGEAPLLSTRGIKFAVCYRRHVPSEHEEEEEEEERGGKEGGGGGGAAATATATATAATAATATPATTPCPGLACRAAVIRTVAEALAASLEAALLPPSAAATEATATAPSVDLKNPDVVCCVEVLPLSLGGGGSSGPALVATLALLPRRSCDGQLRVRGVSEEDFKQSRRGQQKRQ